MIHGIKVLVGDVVELAPHKRANADDMDLERVTVLEIDEARNHIKVVFNNNDRPNEKFFSKTNTVDWFSLIHVTDIERDYKILKVTDNMDTHNNQSVIIVTMAKVIKQVSLDSKGYTISGAPSKTDTDTFIFIGMNYDDLAEYKGTTNRIAFSKFRVDDALIDGKMIKAYFSTAKITEIDDIFIPV